MAFTAGFGVAPEMPMGSNKLEASEDSGMKKVTSNEVARIAGVSQSTVSRAFNREGMVSEATLKRIRAAADKLGYQPNELARSLISRKSNMIGIVMGDILNPFYPAVLNAFTQRLQLLGRHVLLFCVPAGRDVDDVLPLMLQYQVAGVVITSATLSSHMAKTIGRERHPRGALQSHRLWQCRELGLLRQ